jgi:hypothetical protein
MTPISQYSSVAQSAYQFYNTFKAVESVSGSTTTATTTTTTTTTSSTTAVNLVSNPGFESGMNGWTNWGNATVVTGQASSGSYALQVGSAAGGAGNTVAALTAGASYRFSGMAKVSIAGETVLPGVKFLDSTGKVLLEKNMPMTSTAYTAFAIDFVAPAGAATSMVYVWKNAGSGWTYVDNVVLAASTTTTTTTTTTPTPTPPPPQSTCSTAPEWVPKGAWYPAGTVVDYNGKKYIARIGNASKKAPPYDSFDWAPYGC